MKRMYKWFSSASVLPVALYSLSKSDLRAGVLRRYWPEKINTEIEASGANRLWVQAASAGEVQLANLFATHYMQRHPDAELLLTCNTSSGVKVAGSGPWRHVRRFPFDAHPSLLRLFEQFKPTGIVTVEMELWPGLLQIARERRVPVSVINARMAESSVARYRSLNEKFEGLFAYPLYLTRQDADMENLAAIGVPLQQLLITGEMKVDMTVERFVTNESKQPREAIKREFLLGVSTHRGEERILLDALSQLKPHFPELRLLLAPRHQRRAAHVMQLASKAGFTCARLSRSDIQDQDWADVLIEDRFGYMEYWFSRAIIAFVGGSLVQLGGHNVLEPLFFLTPVLTGPHVTNWEHWVRLLDDSGALSMVENATDIARITGIVIEEEKELLPMLVSARMRVEQQLGATDRNVDLVSRLLQGASPGGRN